MLGIMLQKMWHKKWMNLSLLLGCILLVATAVSFPLYQAAAYDRMLQDEFDNYVASTGKWPAQLSMTISSKKENGGKTISSMEELLPNIYTMLGVTEKETISYYYLQRGGIHSEMNRPDANELNVKLGAKSNIEDHIEIISGTGYSDTGFSEDGAYEVLISQDCMVSLGLLVGETIVFDDIKDYNRNPIRMYICGVFVDNGVKDYYWQEKNEDIKNVVFMKFDLFRDEFTGDKAGKFNINCNYITMFEYKDIMSSDVDFFESQTDYLADKSAYKSVISKPVYYSLLEKYHNKYSRISATLAILQIPVLIMLAAFLFMISGQMYEMERNEISVIKSRGSSRAQIFRMYLYQGAILNLAGALIGIPLGMLLSKMLGSTRNFLVFDLSDTLNIRITGLSMLYALGAVVVGMVCLTVPAIRHSRVSIVNLKQQKAMRKKALWEKLFVDIILIAVSGYGFYNFNRNSDGMAEAVLKGESLDPLLYLSSSLMIIGAGLLFLRLQPLILKLIYNIGKNKWKPASFVSFMENVKNGRKQQLIMLFLIMTISLGMYHATVARTIVENAVDNVEYLDGADVIFKEVWTEMIDRDGAPTGEYIEPDADKYIRTPFFTQYTKVYNNDTSYISTSKNGRIGVCLMGIQTKEYGTITWVDKNLNGNHYYNLLNELAVVENGLLVSANFRDVLGYKVGDSVTITTGKEKTVSGVIVDFFDYWPGYTPVSRNVLPDGTLSAEDNYLVITHFEYMHKKAGDMPYEIWAKLADNASEKDIYQWITENDVKLTKYVNRANDLEEAVNDPLLQGTNGVLTLGFVVTIVLCGVGYLIYWIMAIKERELVFGVLRASGFHKKELFHMLINEQIFCGFMSVAAGFIIGKITSAMFVPILQKAYASTNQVLPMTLITNPADLIRLIIVVGGVMIACLAVITVMLLRMNVAKALKLGED